MIYTEMTKKAMKIAYEAHKEQVDKGGLPYIIHPLVVANTMKDEKSTVAALLHDVVEDTDITIEDLREQGFSEDILEALNLLTHRKGTPYMDYIKAIKGNEIARAVKVRDLEHNSIEGRLNEITDKDRARIEKYIEARAYLMSE